MIAPAGDELSNGVEEEKIQFEKTKNELNSNLAVIRAQERLAERCPR